MSRRVETKEYPEPLKLILKLLKDQSKTQKGMCEYTGISHSVVTRWKYENSDTYLQYIDKISEFLGVTSDYLLGRSGTEYAEGTLTKREKEMLVLFRQLDYIRQEHAMQGLRLMGGLHTSTK
jgi:transcriptional regulator with XRE-family HTH domain